MSEREERASNDLKDLLATQLGAKQSGDFSAAEIQFLVKNGWDTVGALRCVTVDQLRHGLPRGRAGLLVKKFASKKIAAIAGPSDYVLKVANMGSPSELDPKTEQQLKDHKGTPTPLIQNWRPPCVAAAVGMPPPLLHQVFGKFIDDYSGITFQPREEDLEFVIRVCKECSSFYSQEANLEMAMHRILQDYLTPHRIYKISPSDNLPVRTDGAIVDHTTSPDSASWMSVLLEVKEDMGKSGDPNYQGARYYGVFYANRHNQGIFNNTVCPTLLLEVVGPHLRVSALSWASAVSVVPLTPMMHTLLVLHDTQHMLALARLLGALRRSVNSLNQWYAATKTQLQATGSPGFGHRQATVGLPYPLREQYSNIRPLVKDKLLYSAVPLSSGSKALVVKFCCSYSKEVHGAWASLDLAPKLHRCERLPGGWWWVEMEFLDPADGWLMLVQVQASERPAACDEALRQLRLAHQALLPHGSGKHKRKRFVHGDMRGDANVLYRPAPGSVYGWEVRFVDFERAGEEGVAKYPPFMNPGICWPAGVEYDKPLKQQHDVELLVTSCSRLAPSWGGSAGLAEGQAAVAAAAESAVVPAAADETHAAPKKLPAAAVPQVAVGPALEVPQRQQRRSRARRAEIGAYRQLQPMRRSPLLPPRCFMHNARPCVAPQVHLSLRLL